MPGSQAAFEAFCQRYPGVQAAIVSGPGGEIRASFRRDGSDDAVAPLAVTAAAITSQLSTDSGSGALKSAVINGSSGFVALQETSGGDTLVLIASHSEWPGVLLRNAEFIAESLSSSTV